VPWISLGISETDATDGWDHRFTYRVFAALAADNGMDMSSCDPAGTEVGAVPRACNNTGACTSTTLASCTKPADFLSTKGFQVRNVAGTVVMDPASDPPTGAAYVVISAGETGGGAYLYGSGTLGATAGTDGNEEQKNYANLALQPYYLDDAINDTPGATHFDDVVSRPSVQTVASKAGLGPRSH
jgi:hypothetical protein